MHRAKLLLLLLVCTMLLPQPAGAQAPGPLLEDMPQMVRPGRAERFYITVPQEGTATLSLQGDQGAPLTIQSGYPLKAGRNSFFWDGSDVSGQYVAPGEYHLVALMGDQSVSAPLKVGPVGPMLDGVRISDASLRPGAQGWMLMATANMPGVLRLTILTQDMRQQEVMHQQVPAGELHIPWDGTLAGEPVDAGLRTLALDLTDEGGFSSNPHHVLVQVLGPVTSELSPSDEGGDILVTGEELDDLDEPLVIGGEQATDEQPLVIGPEPGAQELAVTAPAEPPPAMQYKIPSLEPIPKDQWGTSYWTTPVGEWNEEKIWEIMMQPLTVIRGADQRQTYKLRKTPDADRSRDNIVGEITFESQGVHILETLDNGWTLVEANNSSYGPDNRTRRGYGEPDAIIKGYVETKYLERITPRDDYGLLIDKLTQEMYVFKDGELLTTLIISTGLPTRQQPWNETPSGEYLMVSRVGEFNAGNLVCPMAMRINGGMLIHEVPYILNTSTGYKDYSIQERVLGQKASHGCIRVQRKNNDDGISMTWLWNNIKLNTKVLVWDDFPGRFYEYPPQDLQLYYNPVGGKFYHANQNCPSIRDRYLPLEGNMLYGELDHSEYAALTPCTRCNPPIRVAQIDQINRDNGF